MPVWYPLSMGSPARMVPPVGKSGAGMTANTACRVAPGLRAPSVSASTSSLRLCGGMEVAMPTAMPVEPLSSRLGSRAGSTAGSFWLPSNVDVYATVDSLRSASNMASDRGCSLHSV